MDTTVRFAFKMMVPKRTNQEKPAAAQPTLLHAPAMSSASDSSSHHHIVLTAAGPVSLGSPAVAVAVHDHGPSTAAEPAGQESAAGRQLLSNAGRTKPVSRAKSCTVCHEVDARNLYCCGSCEALLHEDCTTRLPWPKPLDSYCLFCPDCQREPWQPGAWILAGVKARAEGMTTDELKCAVEECRQSCVKKRVAAGNAAPKTYDGLRGDNVTFLEQFAQMTSKCRGRFEQVPESAGQKRTDVRWRLKDVEWGMPQCQDEGNVVQAQTPVVNKGFPSTETLVVQTEHSLDKQTAPCNEPASSEQQSGAVTGVDVSEAVVPAIAVPSSAVQDGSPGMVAPVSVVADSAVPCVAQKNSYNSQTAPGIIGQSYRKLVQNNVGGCKGAKPSSSQKTRSGLGSASPLRTQTIPSMLKRKAQAELLSEQLGTAKRLKACTEVIDLTCEPDTPFTAGRSQVATAAPFAQDWAELSGPMQTKAVEAIVMQQGGVGLAAVDDVLDMITLAKLDEQRKERQAMQKSCVKTHVARLSLGPVYCAKVCKTVDGGGSAEALIDRMYMGFQETLRWHENLTSAEQENANGNYFRVFLGQRPSLTQREM